MVIASVLSGVVLADWVTGFAHWLEDGYIHKDMPLLGQLAEDNRLHHSKPRAFLSKNWWQSCWESSLVAAGVVLVAAYLNLLSLGVWVFALLIANANQIHKWTHQNAKEKGPLVHWLQKLRIIQTPREHARHHSGEKNTHYCIITNFSNPVFEKLRVWQGLDWMMCNLLGVRRINP